MNSRIWQPILEDKSVKLTPLGASDFETLYSVASDHLIWEQHPSPDRYKREVFQLYFDGAVSSKTAFLIFDQSDGQLVGATRYYDYRPASSSVGIGYTFLARSHWGGTFNASVKKLLLDYAFQYIDNVYFHIGIHNIRSQKAILKLGATKVNTIDFELNGNQIPHCEYVIRKTD